MKKSTRAPTNVSNGKLAVTSSLFRLSIRNHALPYSVGPTPLEIRQIWITKKNETLASNALIRKKVRQSKLSLTMAEEANERTSSKESKDITLNGITVSRSY